MDIRIGYDLVCECAVPTPMILMLSVHPSRKKDVLSGGEIKTDPKLKLRHYSDSFGNRCTRIVAPAGRVRFHADGVVRDSGLPDAFAPDAQEVAVADLPDDVLVFLVGSRYCETDRLSNDAWALFGNVAPGWTRVQAICDFVHHHITFGYQHARSTRTAAEAFNERIGVCRDFAHLAVTLCRAMNIPARYCTGYLGDIGVPADPAPMDFSAWFEVYLGGQWYAFDARHNIPRIGRIVMARGRDAADVPLINTFGPHYLQKFEVWTDEVQAEVKSKKRAA
jgi:transglutaminase-like putative cysteine protease